MGCFFVNWLDFPPFYWVNKLHKCLDKQRYIDESYKFDTPLNLFAKYYHAFSPWSEEGVRVTLAIVIPRVVWIQMWIPKSFNDKVEDIKGVFGSNISNKDRQYNGQNVQVIHMMQVLIEDILIMIGACVYQRIVDITMDTNHALRFADLFLCSYD